MIAAVDTNVLISGILFGGIPGQIVSQASEGVFTLALSPAVIEELQGVLLRRKFGLSPEAVRVLVDDIESAAVIVQPRKHHHVVPEDPDDDAIVDCAVEAQASYIVSGDTHLTSLGEVAGIEVVTPTQFLQITESLRR